jgi:hypothetical protein
MGDALTALRKRSLLKALKEVIPEVLLGCGVNCNLFIFFTYNYTWNTVAKY